MENIDREYARLFSEDLASGKFTSTVNSLQFVLPLFGTAIKF